MSHPRSFISISLLNVLSVFLSAILLTSLDDRWAVAAAPKINASHGSALSNKLHRRVDNNIPGPPVSDYPSDEVIYITCGEIGRDQSVMFTEIGDSFPAKYFALLNNKKIYTDLFPEDPEPFTKMLGRSLKWYQDFADRYSRIYSERSSGDVFLVSNWPEGPMSRCSVWYRIEFPILRLNPAVERVILVDKLNYGNQVEIWPVNRRSSDDQGGDDGGDPPLNLNPLEPGPDRPRLPGVSPVGGATGALGFVLGGDVPAALGTLVLPALDSAQSPSFPSPSDTPPYYPNGQNLQDVLFGNQASLTGQDLSTFTGSGSLDGVDISILPQELEGTADGADGISASGSEASIWSGQDSTGSSADDTDLFSGNGNQLTARNFAILDKRDSGTCFDWAGNGDDPALVQSGVGGDPSFTAGGKPQWATIHVIQYRNGQLGAGYSLDLSVLLAGITNLASEEGLNAPLGEWVSILSPLPYRVYVKTSDPDEAPLQFRYGQEEWDSNEVELHECIVDEWKSGHRTVDCNFSY